MKSIPKNWMGILAAILISIASLLVSLSEEEPLPPPPMEVKVDGADRDLKQDETLVLGENSQEVLEDTEDGTAHPDVQIDTPDELRGKDSQPKGVLPQGGGAQEFPGCETRFVGSYSARTASIKGLAVHYTAGGNLPGKADMNGLTAYSDRNPVSWHFLIDREGHCYYSVPLNGKAWTIGNLNSQTVNIDVIGRGNEPDYAGTAGFRKLTMVVREVARRYNFPIRLAQFRNCVVTRSGIGTHWMGGGCSGGHIDVKPYSITDIIRRIGSGPASPTAKLSKASKGIVFKRCYHFRLRFKKGQSARFRAKHLKWSRYWKRKAGAKKAQLDRLHAGGRSWKSHSLGTRRKVLARTERFNRADRRAVCG